MAAVQWNMTVGAMARVTCVAVHKVVATVDGVARAEVMAKGATLGVRFVRRTINLLSAGAWS